MVTQYTEAQQRAHITTLQSALRRIALEDPSRSPLVPDGVYGEETEAEVRLFQRARGLPETGVADYDTWTAVFAEAGVLFQGDTSSAAPRFFTKTLTPGARGSAVVVLQLMLGTLAQHYAGVPTAAPTGEYDEETTQAVRVMQRIFLLPETGDTDRATWDALTRAHNMHYDQTPLYWREDAKPSIMR